MSKKIIGNYSAAEASKAINNIDHICCKVTDDGTIYVFSGYFIFKMCPQEYAAIAQPMVHREAGNWTIYRNSKRDFGTFSVENSFSDAVKAAQDAAPLDHCLLFSCDPKNPALRREAFYSKESDFAAFYNAAYISALTPAAQIKTTGALKPAVACNDGKPFAVILPVHADEKLALGIRAYFAAGDDSSEGGACHNINALQSKLDACKNDLAQAQAYLEKAQKANAAQNERIGRVLDENDALRMQISRLKDEISALRKAQQPAPAESRPEPKTAAEQIAARFASMTDVTATIKGAHTAAPVVWLAGDTKKHAAEIEAAGAVWSSKKSAYYYRVA